MSEETLRGLVAPIAVATEGAAAVVIGLGVLVALGRFLWTLARTRNAEGFVPLRLDLGRFLAVGLEFQLAADLLRTAVAPSFEEIGKLAAVAAIRTALNYFLALEVAREREEIAAPGVASGSKAGRNGSSPERQ